MRKWAFSNGTTEESGMLHARICIWKGDLSSNTERGCEGSDTAERETRKEFLKSQ
jgi:hypothetical protein